MARRADAGFRDQRLAESQAGVIRFCMGIYDKLILPRLLDLAMRNRRLASYRETTIGTARGLVLEIGVGSGLNLPLYSPRVDRVIGIDPSSGLLRLATKSLMDAHVPV